MTSPGKPRTLYEKVFDDHIVAEREDGTILLYIDRHLVHEVTSPQAFAGLDNHHRQVRHPELTLATSDHNVPTTARRRPVKTASFFKRPDSRLQVQTLEHNVRKHKIAYLGLNSSKQGIVHIIGPELGFTLPGTTLVCGDSHTSTHGAFGALAFGIGTSEVEHVLATQTIVSARSKNMKILVKGELAEGVGSKDLMLFIISKIGTAGGTGMVIEFCGSAIEHLSMESRMALCNMSIEAGARAGMIAPDQITLEYVKDRPMAPALESWDEAEKYWLSLKSDPDAHFDRILDIDAKEVTPTVTWGTSPEQAVPMTGSVPFPEDFKDKVKQESCKQALKYMGLEPGTKMMDIPVDKVFIGSCSNARLEDFRIAAQVLKGKKISSSLKLALAVPGSGTVKEAAEREGLDQIFKDAGFQWREAGCSLCVGLNEDALLPFERCASTSNRNFESRQGTAGRTHLVSPVVAAATAIAGKLAYLRPEEWSILQEPKESKSSDCINDKRPDWSGSESDSGELDTPDNFSIPKDNSTTQFKSVKGTVAVIDRANIDTDAIFPKQFCTTIERRGLGSALFHNLRYDSEGVPNPDFILNHPEHQNDSILLATGPNFACGSSREHAVWALQDFGFKCVLAPSFADIFYNNCFKNGLLPAVLDTDTIERVLAVVNAGRRIEIDLPSQSVLDGSGRQIGKFAIEEHRKNRLLKGQDEIETTLQLEKEIARFEEERRIVRPWVDASARFASEIIRLETKPRKALVERVVEPSSIKW